MDDFLEWFYNSEPVRFFIYYVLIVLLIIAVGWLFWQIYEMNQYYMALHFAAVENCTIWNTNHTDSICLV